MSNLVSNDSQTSLEGEIQCSYTWTIKDYENQISRRGVNLTSDIFEFVEPDGRILKWRLSLRNKKKLHRNNDEAVNESSEGYILLESLNDYDVPVVFLLSIVNVPYSKAKHTFCTSQFVFSKKRNYTGSPIFSSENEIIRKSYKNYSCDGSLTINCDINYKSKTKRNHKVKTRYNFKTKCIIELSCQRLKTLRGCDLNRLWLHAVLSTPHTAPYIEIDRQSYFNNCA